MIAQEGGEFRPVGRAIAGRKRVAADIVSGKSIKGFVAERHDGDVEAGAQDLDEPQKPGVVIHLQPGRDGSGAGYGLQERRLKAGQIAGVKHD